MTREIAARARAARRYVWERTTGLKWRLGVADLTAAGFAAFVEVLKWRVIL